METLILALLVCIFGMLCVLLLMFVKTRRELKGLKGNDEMILRRLYKGMYRD